MTYRVTVRFNDDENQTPDGQTLSAANPAESAEVPAKKAGSQGKALSQSVYNASVKLDDAEAVRFLQMHSLSWL